MFSLRHSFHEWVQVRSYWTTVEILLKTEDVGNGQKDHGGRPCNPSGEADLADLVDHDDLDALRVPWAAAHRRKTEVGMKVEGNLKDVEDHCSMRIVPWAVGDRQVVPSARRSSQVLS